MYSRLTHKKLSNKSEFTLQGAHEYFLTYYIHKIFFKESWKVSGNIEKSWFVVNKLCREAIVLMCVCLCLVTSQCCQSRGGTIGTIVTRDWPHYPPVQSVSLDSS